MERKKQLTEAYPLSVFLFASPIYWPDPDTRRQTFKGVARAMQLGSEEKWTLTTIESEEDAAKAVDRNDAAPALIVPLSGGVQPWMKRLCADRKHLAIFNAYLPEALPLPLSGQLMHANAHPSCTDFFASCRLSGKNVNWLSTLEAVDAYRSAWQAVCRLKSARFLKVGETEPWVINSCRDPKVISEKIGCEVLPIERDALYRIYETISEEEASKEAKRWSDQSESLVDIGYPDILKASKVTIAMRKALAAHQADGLSMACFAMIGDIDTTSCLALSALNDSANEIGACEGDLDAAITLYLLKAMGADFVWISNPIIHANNTIDLAHCTAPTCACGSTLQYKLMRHHESGRGVAPEVVLPDGIVATAARIGVQSGDIVSHIGMTERQKKLPACHTQIRLHVESSQKVIDSLLGTHFVLSYGNYANQIQYAAQFLGFSSYQTLLPSVTASTTPIQFDHAEDDASHSACCHT
jgi:L-fucose isomerase-like protein